MEMKQQITKMFLLTSMLISTGCGAEGPDLIAVKPCVGTCVADVDPDSSTQPFITLYRNAANGDTLFRRRGFFDVDSIDITISYVAGRLSVLPSGTPSLVFDIRNSGTSNVLATKLIAITQRGIVVQADVRLRLTEMNANGARRFPAGRYDLFVVMPLAGGRVLGAQTGYPIQF